MQALTWFPRRGAASTGGGGQRVAAERRPHVTKSSSTTATTTTTVTEEDDFLTEMNKPVAPAYSLETKAKTSNADKFNDLFND